MRRALSTLDVVLRRALSTLDLVLRRALSTLDLVLRRALSTLDVVHGKNIKSTLNTTRTLVPSLGEHSGHH